MSSYARRPLLGSLASTPWLSRHGEVLAVQCIRFLLEEKQCRLALHDLLFRSTRVELPEDAYWRSESVLDEGRPDLVAGELDGPPQVVVEAKFEHLITSGQVQAYLRLLQQAPPGQAALVLLVPEHRRAEAQAALASVQSGVASAVVTWDEVASAFRGVSDGDPFLMHDVRQFEGLCETYGAKDIRPLTTDELREWQSRLDDLKVLIDRVSSELSIRRLLPLGREHDMTRDAVGFYRRYVSGDHGPDGATMAIGVRKPRPGHQSPVYVRYHLRTRDFPAAKQRLLASELPVDIAERGHAYVPLEVPTGVSGAEVVRRLVEQARQVHRVALGREWPLPSGG